MSWKSLKRWMSMEQQSQSPANALVDLERIVTPLWDRFEHRLIRDDRFWGVLDQRVAPALDTRCNGGWKWIYGSLDLADVYSRLLLPKLNDCATSRATATSLGFTLEWGRHEIEALELALCGTSAGAWQNLTADQFITWALMDEAVVAKASIVKNGGALWALQESVIGRLLRDVLEHPTKRVVNGAMANAPAPLLNRSHIYQLGQRTDGAGLQQLGKRAFETRGGPLRRLLFESQHLLGAEHRRQVLNAYLRRTGPTGPFYSKEDDLPGDPVHRSLQPPCTLEDLVGLRLAERPTTVWSDELRLPELRRAMSSQRRDRPRRRIMELMEGQLWNLVEQREMHERRRHREDSARARQHTGEAYLIPSDPMEVVDEGAAPLTRSQALRELHRQGRAHHEERDYLRDELEQAVSQGEMGVEDFDFELLGEYIPHLHEARIYMPAIRLAARAMLRDHADELPPDLRRAGLLADRIALLVEVHEAGHGVSFRGQDTDGRMFPAA